MKYKFSGGLIALCIAVSTLVTLKPMRVSAEWLQNYDGNWTYMEGYTYATGWRQIGGTWYFFDSYGLMRTGWISSNGDWYYADLSGAMQTGVIQIEGKIYLFSSNGALQKGTNIINGKIYNFGDNGACIGSDYPIPNKGFDYYGNNSIPYIPSQIVSEDGNMSNSIPTDGLNPAKKQYKVKFKDPDAESSDEELLNTKTVDEDTMITLYKPTKSGYSFVEWNTKSDGDGTSYEYNDRIKVKENITLYAQWEKNNSSNTDDSVKVTSILVSGANGLNEIKTKGGTLQMTKLVVPNTATNQSVTWSVVNGATGEATISSTGKLTAVANGTVTVKATANDKSGIVGSAVITISGQ
ncbi:InlB B-repeat-containing protein [Clostridium beijerinckii]|uniref:InlB B-repeat-containing protein n=1 Tax=Clostridium beijerinckii TaxID=1520 RepID=UPI00047C7070|nr:InlB B-repeat-containing protein [Clostridium beijerinckii]